MRRTNVNVNENENGQVHNRNLRLHALNHPNRFPQGHSSYEMVIILQPNLLEDQGHRARLEERDSYRRQGIIFEWVVRGKRGYGKKEWVRRLGLHRQERREGVVRRRYRRWI